MHIVDLRSSPRGRRVVFARTQLPFVLGLVYVAVVVAIVDLPTLVETISIAGFSVGIVATVLARLVPWERFPPAWLLAVAVLDIVAVAFVRAEVVEVLPGVTLLAIFPMAWAAYSFDWVGVALAILGSVFIVAFRFFYEGAPPQSAAEWANTVTLPLGIVAFAVTAFLAARRLKRREGQLAQATRAQLRALSEAQDAEALVTGILDTVEAGVAFFDADGRLGVANAAARTMATAAGFRLDEPPYAGENVLAADRLTRIPPEEQFIPRALQGEIFRGHLAWLGPPDAQMAVLASSNQLRRRDGSVQGTVVVAHDVTDLADAIEVREQFLRTVSHELRTPLTSVTGFLALIDDAVGHEDPKLRQYIDVVNRRADDLLDRITDLVSATACDRDLRFADVDIGEIVDAAARRIAKLADARSTPVHVAHAARVQVRADRDRLEEAVAEILTNAVKFGEPESPVSVSCRAHDDRVRLTVSNGGVGLSHAEQRRVFDRFYRTAHARSRAVQGYGLGLTRVRAIVNAHEGRVHIESDPGERTTVTLELPAVRPEARRVTA
ncbi:sensor histidine kinase [Microbacterium testaceum]|uniref:Sensor-like histidine kinase SenX3 n=1 Tax=Microbacterium testaceum TaxID=2033 RepID=A0A147F6F1_MICTE|nr:ATP-binding protein [Microbacterium testaceum]KTS10849.1 histidine kinase [Microbacterium testaceum]